MHHEEQQLSLEQFVAERGDRLLRTAALLAGSRADGEDLLQSALERLLRNWRRIDGDPESYVRRTLYNLATDGWRRVPASVTFNGHKNRSCRGGTGGANIRQVFGLRKVITVGPPSRDYVMVIHPSDLPAGIGVQISTYRSVALIEIALVHASPRCTGS